MFHLIFKGNRAPPLHSQVVTVLMLGGAVCGEALQQHHIGACAGIDTHTKQLCEQEQTFVTQPSLPPKDAMGAAPCAVKQEHKADPRNTHQQQHPDLMFRPDILLRSSILNILKAFQLYVIRITRD